MSIRRFTTTVALSVLALAAASSSQAMSYDAVADYSASSATGVWSYGTGVTGTTFTPDPTYLTACGGASGIGCWQGADTQLLVPAVMKNFTGSTQDVFSTVVFPTNVLNVHPGLSTDSIVEFTAPTTGAYTLSGFFQLLDVRPSGVNVIIDATVSGIEIPLLASELTGPPATFPSTDGGVISFSDTISLSAGDTIAFGVNNDGSFYNDSTGLSASISAVPEPAAWSLMMIGFGAMGAMSRRRRGIAVA